MTRKPIGATSCNIDLQLKNLVTGKSGTLMRIDFFQKVIADREEVEGLLKVNYIPPSLICLILQRRVDMFRFPYRLSCRICARIPVEGMTSKEGKKLTVIDTFKGRSA